LPEQERTHCDESLYGNNTCTSKCKFQTLVLDHGLPAAHVEVATASLLFPFLTVQETYVSSQTYLDIYTRPRSSSTSHASSAYSVACGSCSCMSSAQLIYSPRDRKFVFIHNHREVSSVYTDRKWNKKDNSKSVKY